MRETKQLVKALEAQGWRVELRKGGHFMAYPPDTTLSGVTFSSTPSDHRSIPNTIAQLCQRGFIWPWPPEKKTTKKKGK